MTNTATALTGHYIPAPKPNPKSAWYAVDVANQQAANNAVSQQPMQHIKGLQDILNNNRKTTVNSLFSSMNPRLRKCIYLLAGIERTDMQKQPDDLTGRQRHQLFCALKNAHNFIQQLQSQALWNNHAWHIGELEPLQSVTSEQLAAMHTQQHYPAAPEQAPQQQAAN